jgi:hypothetical protein
MTLIFDANLRNKLIAGFNIPIALVNPFRMKEKLGNLFLISKYLF